MIDLTELIIGAISVMAMMVPALFMFLYKTLVDKINRFETSFDDCMKDVRRYVRHGIQNARNSQQQIRNLYMMMRHK